MGHNAGGKIILSVGGPGEFVEGFIQNSTVLKPQYALSWFALDSNAQQNFYVQQINMVMFNEESDYMTYDDVMIHNTFSDSYYGVVPTASSVKEIAALGITASNVAV